MFKNYLLNELTNITEGPFFGPVMSSFVNRDLESHLGNISEQIGGKGSSRNCDKLHLKARLNTSQSL